MKSDLDIVINMIKQYDNWHEFRDITKDDLIYCHHTLGREIRNELHLWQRTWTPEIVDGVDKSPDHPDAVSMRLMEQAWEYLQNES